MESVGFKEWALVCEALGHGRQSIILRKGGIAEGREGFSFKHRDFFLFPTWFHEQPERVRDEVVSIPPQNDALVTISYAAQVDVWRTISSWKTAESLSPLHILQPEVVRERFEWNPLPRLHPHLSPLPNKGEEEAVSPRGNHGLHVALVRVFRLNPVWTFPNQKKYGGCRSWVELPNPPNDLKLEPILSDAEHAKHRDEFLTRVSDNAATPRPSP